MSVGSDDEVGRRDRQDRVAAVAVFRFQLISPAVDENLSARTRGALVREIAAAWHTDPFGRRVQYSRDTLDRWIRMWRQGGFEALVPSARMAPLRTDTAILAVAEGLKRENPARTAAQVERILLKSQGWSPSQSTLLRLFHRLELPGANGQVAAGEVFGRFEAGEPNQMWTGDALHGKRIGGRKTYLFAFIDDHTRFVPGYRWGFAEDTVRLAAALRRGLEHHGIPRAVYVDNGSAYVDAWLARACAKLGIRLAAALRRGLEHHGIPQAVYVDNGSAYVDAWLARACAKLGIRLTHSTPGRPQGRGKIERWFRTVNEQFLVEVKDTTAEDLAAQGVSQAEALLELNRLFKGWVETVYHTRVHTETDQTPLERWRTGFDRSGTGPQMPAKDDLREAFWWSQFRTVNRKTATVSLLNNKYEVDPVLIGRRVELLFDPFDLTDITVHFHGKTFAKAVPYLVGRHSHPKARPETPQQPPAPTHIDYLNLVAADHHDATGAAINFHALTTPPPAGTDLTGDTTGSQVPGQMPLPGMPAPAVEDVAS